MQFGTEFRELSQSGIGRNSGNRLDPESVEVAGIQPNFGSERNSWESVRFHWDGIPGIGWNCFRNGQHRGIG